MIFQLLKPFVYFWASLNFIDDLTIVMKIARLVEVGNVRQDEDPDKICDFCDEVMEDVLKGTEGLRAAPCSWICLGISKCTKMCETIQEISEKSGEFPCIAAGYCVAEDDEKPSFENEIACKKGPWFSCEPKKFCRKRRAKYSLKYTCDLKPGMGRWIHMKKTASKHATAIAEGLIHQKRCGEPDAGPYCIAKSSGFGRAAEILAWFLSILYGGYASTVAIESPGGDDDQQWLTYWVMFVEYFPDFHVYYQLKLIFIVWLMFFDGAATVYRMIRRRLSQWLPTLIGMLYDRNQSAAQNKLDSIRSVGGRFIDDQIALLEWELKRNLRRRSSVLFSYSAATESYWEYDYSETKCSTNQTSLAAEERLHRISKWLLSSEGLQKMEDIFNSNTVAMLLEQAAAVISFQPKFLNIHLISTKPGAEGKLPIMDPNGKADCYVKFALVPNNSIHLQNGTSRQHIGIKRERRHSINLSGTTKLNYLDNSAISRIAYRTLEPKWNQMLELPIKGGMLDNEGNYRSHDTKDTILLVEAWDADCGKWGIALEIFRVFGCAFVCILVVSYMLGAIDFLFSPTLSDDQWLWKKTIITTALSLTFGITLSWVMSVLVRADDEFIGKSAVPLEILSDQREHSLMLKLRDARKSRGILRVKLRLSEN
eukprot:CAMPEP_0116154802 /NCGR_PEP_ID=MMETSP0329-20121206/21972_1 /TAXON_ID=697910 /ORGANISM="Pseudo-nitzschia arenysensis, Strain B593" /LENGTH=651 /DNA_ID=CAMNT_0003651801 /DNA_START=30 /DNA_END=1984 /DNA_ORIENTATION=+